MPRTGEEIQALGAAGSQRAKRWLEATCRAEVLWNNPGGHSDKLQFRKAGANPASSASSDFFSMDLGGLLLGGDAHGDMFVAEVKNYASQGDQGVEYRKFLAKCYLIESVRPDMYEHYLWITWVPFLGTKWTKLLEVEFVASAVLETEESRYIALGDESIASDIVARVADKLLIVVLSERQERFLSLHGDELIGVRKALLEIRDGA